jgi:hypothetical protein
MSLFFHLQRICYVDLQTVRQADVIGRALFQVDQQLRVRPL